MTRKVAAAAALAVLAAVTACSSTPASAPVTGTTAANTLVCQHYLAQRAWVKHLTFPTLADGLRFAGYVAADAAQSTGKLGTDLGAMSADEQANRSSYAASLRVLADCT